MHIVYYIQKAFNEAFADAPVGSECTTDTLQIAERGLSYAIKQKPLQASMACSGFAYWAMPDYFFTL